MMPSKISAILLTPMNARRQIEKEEFYGANILKKLLKCNRIGNKFRKKDEADYFNAYIASS